MIIHQDRWIAEIEEWNEIRIDKWLSEIKGIPRSRLKDPTTCIKVNGKPVKPSKKIKGKQNISVEWQEHVLDHLEAQEIPLDILFENSDVIVIDKEQGRVVHPGNGCPDNTLVNGLLYHYSEFTDWEGDALRPGIVHRLDKDTSGVIITAKNHDALLFLSGQFSRRETRKTYLAVIEGAPPEDEGLIDNYLGRDSANRIKFKVVQSGGKNAITRYKVLKKWQEVSLVQLRILTGRTHQIRVHMAYLGCPVWGDPLYQKKKTDQALMLHAWKLKIVLPGEERPSLFKAPVPIRFRRFISKLDDFQVV